MKTKKFLSACGVLALLVLIGWFVWPTPWVYSELDIGEKGGINRIQYRTNRFTGQKQVYTILLDHWDWRDLASGM